MITTKVSFECTIAMPGYSNVKPGIVEADLEPGETIEQAWSELNRRAIAWHKAEYPHLYLTSEDRGFKTFSLLKDSENVQYGTNTDPYPSMPAKPEERRIGVLSSDIDSCPDIKTLETYKFLAKSKPELQEAYNKKMNELLAERPNEFTDGLT